VPLFRDDEAELRLVLVVEARLVATQNSSAFRVASTNPATRRYSRPRCARPRKRSGSRRGRGHRAATRRRGSRARAWTAPLRAEKHW